MPKSVMSAKAAVAAGALTIYLKPLLAADAMIDLGPVLKGVTEDNFSDRKLSLTRKIGELVKGKLATDAKLDGLPKVMDAVEEIDAKDEEPESEEESEEEKAKKVKAAKDKKAKDKRAKDAAEKSESEKRKFLENTLSEDEMASWDALCASAKDAEIEEPDEREEDKEEEKPAIDKGKKRAHDEEEDGEEKVSKKAMDAAISAATAKATADAIATQRAIRTAEEEVTPIVGKLAMSFDSAEGVYKQALKMRNVDVKGVHPSAYRAILKNLPAPTRKGAHDPIAMDSSGVASFNELFPEATKQTAA